MKSPAKAKAPDSGAKNGQSRLPGWFKDDLVIPFKAGIASVFIVHGDVNGLVPMPNDFDIKAGVSYIPVRKFFETVFDERPMVIFYNIASGVRFLKPSMEKDFKRSAGLESDDDAAKDPVAAAKAGLAAKRAIPREPDACLPLIEKVLKSSSDVAVIINSIHFIAPQTGGGVAILPNERANIERLKNWGQDEELRANNNMVLLLTDQAVKVSTELRQSDSEIHTAFISRPDKEERKEFIASLKDFPIPKDISVDVLAHASQGMSLRQILEVFLHSKKTDKPISLDYIKDKKREILNAEYGEILELVEPERGLEDIGGMDHVKEYFKDLLDAIKSGESRLVSMGVTLMGPPGTGKTALVEALAKEAGFNFVKTKNIRSMWVGESEARMQKLVYGLRSLAPVVVMNDEADLANASRDAPKGDSGVSERLMKMWMELLSDPRIRGQIIVISCTNRPDRIDPALKRSGRSDERILIPMPAKNELPEIFRVMFKRYKIPVEITDFAPYAEMTNGFSGADIEKISLNSYKFAFKKGEEAVSDAALREAIEDFIPSASQGEIDRMTVLGILECSSRRLLPPNIAEILNKIRARNLVENLAEILEQIKARNIAEID